MILPPALFLVPSSLFLIPYLFHFLSPNSSTFLCVYCVPTSGEQDAVKRYRDIRMPDMRSQGIYGSQDPQGRRAEEGIYLPGHFGLA